MVVSVGVILGKIGGFKRISTKNNWKFESMAIIGLSLEASYYVIKGVDLRGYIATV